MKPDFALSLSFQGIALLHRSDGGWQEVGAVPVDSPDLAAELGALRDRGRAIAAAGGGAQGAAGAAMACKIVIPNDLVRYIALDNPRADESAVREALTGATPYALADLVYDFRAGGGRMHVAAVARENLEEAEVFATDHGFAPVAFVAGPEPFTFPGEVLFGPTRLAAAILPAGTVIERDGAAETAGKAGSDAAPAASGVESPDPGTGDAPAPPPPSDPAALPGDPARAEGTDTDKAAAEAAPQEPPAPAAPEEPNPAKTAEAPDSAFDIVAGGAPETPPEAPPESPPGAPPASAQSADTAAGADAAPPVFASRSRPVRVPGPADLTPPAPPLPPPSGAAGPVEPVFVSRTPRDGARREPTLGPPPPRILPPGGAPSAQDRGDDAVPEAPFAAIDTEDDDSAAPPVRIVGAPAMPGMRAARAGIPAGAAATGRKAAPAPRPTPRRGRPGLGLMLVLILLVALGLVALWSTTLEGGLASLFGADRPASAVATAEGPAEPVAAAGEAAPIATTSLSPPEAMPAAVPEVAPEVAPEPAPDATDALGAGTVAAGTLVTPDEADRIYQATGVWLRAPRLPVTPRAEDIALLDTGAPDAPRDDQGPLALPAGPGLAPDASLPAQPDPPPAGTVIARDARGLIVATPEGVLLPNGVTVFAGAPPRLPPTRPGTAPPPPPSPGEQAMSAVSSAGIRPAARPESILAAAIAAGAVAAGPESGPESGPGQEPDTGTGAQAAPGSAGPEPDATEPDAAGPGAADAPATAPDAAAQDDAAAIPPGAVALALVAPRVRPLSRPAAVVPPPPFAGPAPRARPADLAPDGASSTPVEAIDAALAAVAAEPAPILTASAMAVPEALRPDARPNNFNRVVQTQTDLRARAEEQARAVAAASTQTTIAAAPTSAPATAPETAPAPAPEPAPAPQPEPAAAAASVGTGALTTEEAAEAGSEVSNIAAPAAGPTPASVAQSATVGRAINLREINLIGVFGSRADRRALVRLANGRMVRVGVGDTLDGGQVVAIGDGFINYTRRGQTVSLHVPG